MQNYICYGCSQCSGAIHFQTPAADHARSLKRQITRIIKIQLKQTAIIFTVTYRNGFAGYVIFRKTFIINGYAFFLVALVNRPGSIQADRVAQ